MLFRNIFFFNPVSLF